MFNPITSRSIVSQNDIINIDKNNNEIVISREAEQHIIKLGSVKFKTKKRMSKFANGFHKHCLKP